MRMALGMAISSVVIQVARLTRDLWTSINDTWTNEQRKWQDII
jgi:hypothetical protein|tara:strand:+ start:328 stop:456 length:129 start_codon:yes stop_codon:yes gene_type:complete